MNVSFPIVSVPERGLLEEFSLASNVITALPVPLLADVNRIQFALLRAVQLQLPPVVIWMLPAPPLNGNDVLVGASEQEQEEVYGVCATVSAS